VPTLKPTVTAEEARAQILALLSLIEQDARDDYMALLAGIMVGDVDPEDAAGELAELAEEVKDEAMLALAKTLDAFWDFEQTPGGPVGAALEELDGGFWQAVTEGLGDLGVAAVVWVKDVLTFDDLERLARADALMERAAELDEKATGLSTRGKTRRAARLQRRATRKRGRADELLASAGGAS